MKNSLVVILVFITIFQSSSILGQAKYDKMLKKAETAYEVGSYKTAQSALAKFKKKATKKLGAQNGYMPTYYLFLAKYDLASGMILDFESNLRTAENTSIAINQESSLKNGVLILDAAELYLQSGAYRVAKEYLARSKKVLDTGGFMTEALGARIDLGMAEVLIGQGFYNESLDLLFQRERYFAGRAIKQESYVDDKGNLKSRKLPEDEMNERYTDYARLLTNIANTYRNKGNFKSADSAFAAASTWIDKNIGESKLAFVKNQFYWSNLIVEGGLEADQKFPRGTGYDRALNNLKVAHKSSHYFGIEIYEQYLKRLLREGNSSRYFNTKLEFEKMINKNFPVASIYNARLKAVEFDAKLSKDQTRNLEADAKRVIGSKSLPRNNITTAEISHFLFELSQETRNYKNSEGYLKDIIQIKSELLGEEAPTAHLAKVHLANFYLDFTNNITEAGKIYEESFIKVVEKEIDPSHKDHLDILNHLAVYYELTDKFNQAISALDKASDVARSKYSDRDYQYGVELTNIARLQIKLGQYEKAEQNVNQSLQILEEFRKEENKKGFLVNAIDTQATLFGIKGLFDEATDALNRSSKIISKASNLTGIDNLTTAKELSSLLIQLGKYSGTEDLLDGLIKDYEKLYGKTSLRLIEPLVNKGRLTLLKGDYTEADKIALRANQIAVSVYTEKSTKAAPTQKLLSDIDYIIGDYEKAEDNILKALASQEKQFGRNHIEVAKSISQLALVKFYKGDDRKEVEKLMLESRDIMGDKLGKDNPQYADILKNVAILYISEKRFDIAFNSLTIAESIWKAKTGRKNNINLASIYTLTGDVFYQQKKYDKAEEFYSKSKDLYEKFFSRTHPEYVKVLSKQAKVYYMEKDFKRSKRNIEEALTNYENFIKQFFPALSEREKAKYWNTIKVDFEFYNTLAFSQLEDFRDLSGKVYNYQLLTKALLLSSSIKIRERILNSNDEALIAGYNDWLRKKEILTSTLSMSAQQLAENEIDPVALGNEVEKIEKELSEKSELFGQNFEGKRITYENVQKSLDKNDVAIEMVRYRHFDHTLTDSIIYVALFVKNDNARPKAIELAEGHRMETRFYNYYRNCITSKIQDNISYKVFWEPIKSKIGQYSTIFISPDGVYNLLNLEAIPTPDGRYVIDNSNIVMVNNTKDLYLRKTKGKKPTVSNTATMFGNPTFYLTASASNNIPSLPGTELEVNQLQELLKQKGWITDKFVEKNATEEHVKEIESPKIFHIATHGFYTPSVNADAATQMTESESAMSENPLLKTGLLLKGAGDLRDKSKYNYNLESGILTAYEAMSLNLDQTDLVVLSACETGLGDISNGEGVYGLQRAFLVAGAKTLIMSMFKVDDEATQKLILTFYRKWLTTGNLRQSFIDAKKEIRVEYPDPINWGAFMMIGLD
ncbi:MAG: CHAT domain-containing protein [Bacteroidia bacterium]|nr:CHAT domain-containing protein [Bacteroidia bacterium]